jgi:hypothetical protein
VLAANAAKQLTVSVTITPVESPQEAIVALSAEIHCRSRSVWERADQLDLWQWATIDATRVIPEVPAMKSTLSALFAIPALLLSFTAFADDAAVYHYGMPLDVAKVLSISQPNQRCEVSQATMVYLDSQGQQHTIKYLRQTPRCSDI